MRYLGKEINDFELISKIKNGDQEAIELIFLKFKPLMINLIYKYYLQHNVEDVLQEVYMVTLDSVYKFKQELNSNFGSYLKLILNRFLSRYKDKQKFSYMNEDTNFDLNKLKVKENVTSYYLMKNWNKISNNKLSLEEKEIFEEYLVYGKISKETREKYGQKKIYNVIFNCKKKLRY